MRWFFKSCLVAWLVCWLSCAPAFAAERITAQIDVDINPSDGDTLVVNGDTRTFKNTVATPSTQVAIGASAADTKSNLFDHIAAYGYTGPLVLLSVDSDSLKLIGQVDQSMAVSDTGSWSTITLSTQTVTTAYSVRVPMTVEAASVNTNIATLLVTGLEDYSQVSFADATSHPMQNFVDLSTAQTITGLKTFSGGINLNASYINNSLITNSFIFFRSWDTHPNDMIFWTYDNGTATQLYESAENGYLSIYDWGTHTPFDGSGSTNTAQILNRETANALYGVLTDANSWTGTNTFTRITNSVIVGSSLTTLANDFRGNLHSMTNGFWVSGGTTNLTSTNIVHYGVQYPQTVNTALANGDNSGLDFGDLSFIKLEAGPSAAFTIAGIDPGSRANGRMLRIYNATTQNMTIGHEDGAETTATNRIVTMTGSDVSTTGNGYVELLYDLDGQRWILTNAQQ